MEDLTSVLIINMINELNDLEQNDKTWGWTRILDYDYHINNLKCVRYLKAWANTTDEVSFVTLQVQFTGAFSII